MRKTKAQKQNERYRLWAVQFSQKAFKIITAVWIAEMIFSAVMMAVAIVVTGQFAYLDTFIIEINSTFRASVIALLLTRTVGNIFQFNNGGIFGESIQPHFDEGGQDL